MTLASAIHTIAPTSIKQTDSSMRNTVLPQGASGASYFIKGFELIRTPGLKRFVVLPLSINLIMFSLAFAYLFNQMEGWINLVLGMLPDFLSWVDVILWPLAVVVVLVSASFLFSTVMNWIAAPFNGLLAEQVEKYLTGQTLDSGGVLDLVKDTPRMLGRELTKVLYYLPRALLFLALLFIPAIGTFLWFGFTAWMMAIQYLDYPFDNHKVPFGQMRKALSSRKYESFTFGMSVSVFAMIPIVNLIVMPVAVCGSTAMWVDKYRDENRLSRA